MRLIILISILGLLMASIFLLSPSSNGSSCFKKPYDVPDCRAKASQGDAQAQYFLGTFYLEGREGLEADYKKTLELYTKAAEQGHVWAPVSYTHLTLPTICSV